MIPRRQFPSPSLLAKLAAGLLASLSLACGRPAATPYSRLHEHLAATYNPQNAYAIVEFLSERWRLRGGGNQGFNESIAQVQDFLRDGGFERVGRIEVLEGPLTLQPLAWEPLEAELGVVSPEKKLLHTYEDTPTLPCKYSGSTPPGGITAEVVYVGSGAQPSDYESKNVRGKIVLGRAKVDSLFIEAVEKRGALGVISDYLNAPEYYQRFPNMVRSGTLPFREPEAMMKRQSWGLKISPRSSAYLRRLLATGPVRLHVEIRTKFFESRQKELVAEIPGTRAAQERVVLVAHIDNAKPGANNNASGVGGQAELARAIARLIDAGRLERPLRTITFLFGAEREGSRLWVEHHRSDLSHILAVLNSDMTGENTRLTGGTFLLERTPDPAMHSPRPQAYTQPNDRHTGWGYRPLKIDPYPGYFLNDLVWSAIEFRAARSGWKVAQNPYEGGSDHDIFLPLLIPTTLDWHWVDDFIGTNLDTPDKVSPAEMENVAVAQGLAALVLASAGEAEGRWLLRLVEKKAAARLAGEFAASRRLLADLADGAVTDTAATFQVRVEKEAALLRDWTRWYDQALGSVARVPVGGASPALRKEIRQARNRLRMAAAQYNRQLLGFRQGGSKYARGSD